MDRPQDIDGPSDPPAPPAPRSLYHSANIRLTIGKKTVDKLKRRDQQSNALDALT